MKFKHNKKRNTAFLYEAVIKELTKAVVSKDSERKAIIVSVIKEYFSPNTILGLELGLYKTLYEVRKVDLYTAERLISETRKDYEKLDETEVFNKQTELIDLINKKIGPQTFRNFVPNFKNIASVAQIFTGAHTAKQRVLLEHKLISSMVSKKETGSRKQELKHIDKLVYKKFVENYNNKYNTKLLKEQNQLLFRYVMSLDAETVDFNIYLNEEIGRLLEGLSEIDSEEVSSDSHLVNKIQEVKQFLTDSKKKKVDEKLIVKIMNIQNLIQELKG